MLITFPSTPAMPTHETDCGYLQEDDAFEVNQVLPDWLGAANPFTAKAASAATVGSKGSLPLDVFVAFVGEYALGKSIDQMTVFEAQLSKGEDGVTVQYKICSMVREFTPPIEADNPGFFQYALEWFADNRRSIRIGVMRSLFWVERERE